MNLADRPTNTNTSQGNANKGGRGGRPLTARAMGQEGRFSKLDMSAAELSSELNLAFGDGVGTTPTPPPPQLNNQALLDLPPSEERVGEDLNPLMDSNDSCPELEPSVPRSGANDPQGPPPGTQGLEPSAVSLLETFAAVARRRATGATTGTGSTTSTTNANNSRNTANSLNSSGIFGRGGLSTNSVSSLVRLALSSNFPGGLLNQAQSYPSLNPGQNNGTPRQTNEAEQVSMEEFLESCRATSLLAELEDEEELPDAEEEENEEDCDDSEDCEDNYDEEGLTSSQEVRNMFGKRKTWDDDHVLKRKFSALIPAFDPRPGRTNTPQTSDLEVPAPGTLPPAPPQGSSSSQHGKLNLVLRGPNLPGVPDVEVELGEGEKTILKAVQTIIQSAALGSKADRMRRVWEPTYVVVYREHKEGREERNEEVGSRRSSSLPQLPISSSTGCSMDEVLQLVRQLYIHMEHGQADQ